MVAIFTLWVTGVRSARGGAAAHTRSGSASPPRRMPTRHHDHWQGTSVYVVYSLSLIKHLHFMFFIFPLFHILFLYFDTKNTAISGVGCQCLTRWLADYIIMCGWPARGAEGWVGCFIRPPPPPTPPTGPPHTLDYAEVIMWVWNVKNKIISYLI